MARSQAFLAQVGDEVFLKVPSDSVPGIAIQYGNFQQDGATGATGTFVAEVSLNTDGFAVKPHANPQRTDGDPTGTYPSSGDWIGTNVTPFGGGAGVATMTAPGIYQLPDAQGCWAVRVRCTVAPAAGKTLITIVAQEYGAGKGE